MYGRLGRSLPSFIVRLRAVENGFGTKTRSRLFSSTCAYARLREDVEQEALRQVELIVRLRAVERIRITGAEPVSGRATAPCAYARQ